MRYEVVLTEDAEHDLEDLYAYIARNDSLDNAEYVLARLLELTESLASFPDRGVQPMELRMVGMQEYRQLLFKPYRVIYRVHGNQVVIYVIADGRRDMQILLARRLLGS